MILYESCVSDKFRLVFIVLKCIKDRLCIRNRIQIIVKGEFVVKITSIKGRGCIKMISIKGRVCIIVKISVQKYERRGKLLFLCQQL